MNLTTVLWNLDTNDWAAGYSEPVEQVQANYQDFIEMGSNGTFANSGNIVLTHEIDNTTMQLALDNLPNIVKNYKHVLDVATCMNITYPYIEQSISYPSFSEAISNSSTTNSTAASSSGAAASGSSGSTAAASGSATLNADVANSAAAVVRVSPGMAAGLLVSVAAVVGAFA